MSRLGLALLFVLVGCGASRDGIERCLDSCARTNGGTACEDRCYPTGGPESQAVQEERRRRQR